MIRSVLAATVVLLAACPSHAGEDPVPDRQAMLRKGAALHDAGDFPGAISIYESLLTRDAGDAAALYEIAFSYSAAKSWSKCVEYAGRGIRIETSIQAATYGLLALCQDDGGHREDALRVFAEAVGKFPQDPQLHFNYAVILGRAARIGEAATQLEAAIVAEPRSASSYLSYAKALETLGREGAAACTYMRFLMMEPQTARSREAGSRLAALVGRQVTMGADGKTTMNLRLPKDAATTQDNALSVALGMSAVSAGVGNAAPGARKAAILATLDAFLKTAASLADREQSFFASYLLSPLKEINGATNRAVYLDQIVALGVAATN